MPVPAPPIRTLDALLPEPLPLMMGVGPTPIPEPVARAHARVLNHLGPLMNGVVESLKDLGRYVLQTGNPRVFGISGPGSAAMEMAMANLLWPGRRALVVVNGTFSGRLAEMGRRAEAEVVTLGVAPGHGVDPERVAEALKQGRFDVVAMVQGETSCGACNFAVPEVAALAQQAGALMVVDTVVTLSTMPLQTDDWGLDVVLSAGQKGLACVPGISLVTFSERAWQQIEARPKPPAQWVLDARLAASFWMEHTYHYTAPTSSILALHEALRLIAEETLPIRHDRHERHSRAVQRGMEALGLEMFAPPEHRLRSALAIRLPPGLDAPTLLAHMEERFNIQMAGAFGLPIFRVGQLGEQCRREPVLRTMDAMGQSLAALGVPCDPRAGVEAAEAVLGEVEVGRVAG
ncbi:MAG: alanine--glyoxylate aminotransferase family protein [Alphaproteobacteria bacterium]|nr:alanine--glyoxylate aminotransferase family protein [Alphaproteobacteria bacterium]